MNINDLPKEIAALARKRQQECTNTIYSRLTHKLYSAFDWSETEEGNLFWDAIGYGNYAPFYDRYGRPSDEWVPKVGEMVLVSDSGLDSDGWEHHTFCFSHNGFNYCTTGQIQEIGTACYRWKYMKPLPTRRRVTRAEIAKALNIEGDNFEIID